LFNEEFFLTRLELAFERAKRRKDFIFAVIAINIRLDPQQEEQVKPDTVLAILREISYRLKKFIRPTDAVARLAGWKFVSLHEDLNEPAEVELIVKRLSEKLSNPYIIKDISFAIKPDLMAVVHETRFRQPVDILNAAKRAMDKAHAGAQPWA
jgi:GGDEF domain-containing protein